MRFTPSLPPREGPPPNKQINVVSLDLECAANKAAGRLMALLFASAVDIACAHDAVDFIFAWSRAERIADRAPIAVRTALEILNKDFRIVAKSNCT